MSDAHFISYSSADALEFALKLADALTAGPPAFPIWLDKRRLEPGQNWDVPLETVGLAQAGLARCLAGADQSSTAAMQASLTAYRAARAITRAPGIVQRALRLSDTLAVVDTVGVLAGVRAVVAGEA